jgi:hypothetical protein
MVDEIVSLFTCLRIFWVKNFAIPMLVVLHLPMSEVHHGQ